MIRFRLQPPSGPMAMNITELTYKDFPEYQAGVFMWKAISPLLILIGTIGSLLSVIVLCRKRMRSSTTMFYLAVLAVTDVFVLYTGLLRYWINYTFDEDLRLYSEFSCKFHIFLVYVSLDFGAWILVALTVDRCLFVCAPFKARKYCTLRRARITAAAMLAFLMVINIHFAWSYGLSPRTIFGDGVDCDAANDDMKQFVTVIWPWIDLFIVCFVPFSIMITCNGIIIRKLAISADKIRRHTVSESERYRHELKSTNQKERNILTPPGQSTRPKISVISTQSNNSNTKVKSASQKTSHLTLMLLSVNCLFLLLTSPIVVYMIGFGTWRETPDAQTEAQLHLWWCVVNLLQYTNNAAHFFLYCLTGPRFRRELLLMMAPKNKVNAEPSVTLDPYH
ncbi:thyrotropin-releasing hormone receptor-like [Haliotis rubra]|uniref:thyrotropin-releasing hormone receptor-like n=1 Tax=Haliotis rubra TaxID=36100 RepID=UPI001EE6223A|nr:thyrotropin-releasing hormone receptor-like [Haliotis rubra]